MTKPHDTEDPTRSSAADAAGMAADYSARHTYARGYDDGRKAAQAERDALRAEVEAMRGALEKIAGIANQPTGPDWEEIEEARRIALDALRAGKVGG